jgi:hypothetical protein
MKIIGTVKIFKIFYRFQMLWKRILVFSIRTETNAARFIRVGSIKWFSRFWTFRCVGWHLMLSQNTQKNSLKQTIFLCLRRSSLYCWNVSYGYRYVSVYMTFSEIIHRLHNIRSDPAIKRFLRNKYERTRHFSRCLSILEISTFWYSIFVE